MTVPSYSPLMSRRPEKKSLAQPDELTAFDHGESRVVEIGQVAIGRSVHEPGWRWSEHIRPVVGTASCQFHHVGLLASGRVHIAMDDGTELDLVPDDVVDIPPGHDAWVVGDEPAVMIDVLGARGWASPPLSAERTLTTVAFTDIVDSTTHASRLGDARWRHLLTDHFGALRHRLEAFRGTEVKTTGDGMLALFDSPARAVRWAAAAIKVAEADGLRVRAGIHTGEVELVGRDVRGVAVHFASRLLDIAGPMQVVVSTPTRALVGEPDIGFEDGGEHRLKGIEGDHRLWVASVPHG